jgi:hypothetical protein
MLNLESKTHQLTIIKTEKQTEIAYEATDFMSNPIN